jgi:hypothetical protein
MQDHATIIVGARTQYRVKVSWQDYDFLMQWPWTYAVSHPRHGGLVYARRSVREGVLRRALGTLPISPMISIGPFSTVRNHNPLIY